MATPFVTAVAAMLKAQYPSLTPAQIKARILNNATQKKWT
ncbi:MAG: S8 family serine peptidase [Oscillospiraceae bacterium]|nr:S8 family serine peptidase [Oscillospiraceae bacterium]